MRQSLLAARDALSAQARTEAAAALAQQAGGANFQAFLPAGGAVIAGYCAIRSELEPALFLTALERRGFVLALPRVTPAGLVFHRLEARQALVKGAFGVAEPPPHWPVVLPALVVTPLLAFDDAGYRLGYGRAFYDRVFKAHPEMARIGVAYSMQRVAEVPREAHDVPLNHVLVV
ncbi:COG0212 5-formyltetrahydrofolate cyclo-ligase [Rhabdaerophilaceae bacterium]